MRGRNNNNNSNNNNGNNGNRKAPNPLQRSYESNGPDVKVRGTAQNVAEKYLQLARDAQSSGDPVAAENYFQHAEHYYRILLAAQEQMSQQFGHSFPPNRAFSEDGDDGEEEGDDDSGSFQQQVQPRPDQRPQPSPNGYGYGENRGEGQPSDGQQPQNGQRFERQPRQDRPNQDRQNPDRQGQDRNGQDRNGQDRPNQDRANQDRNGNRRFDRNERRFDRPEGQQNGQGGYQPRFEPPVPVDQPDVTAPVGVAPQAQPERRPEPSERPERPERAPRPERRPRREREIPADGDVDLTAALPSFLTTPVRVPIAVPQETPDDVPAAREPAQPETPDQGATDADAAPKRAVRRRRSPREVMDALGSDPESPVE